LIIGFSICVIVLCGCNFGFFNESSKNVSQNTNVQVNSNSNSTITYAPVVPAMLPDPAFGTGGKVVTALSSRWDRIRALTFQGSSKGIIAVGSSYPTPAAGKAKTFALTRYDQLGNLDRSFGNAAGTLGSGIVTAAIGTGDSEAVAVFPLGDGSLLVAGTARNASNADFALVKFSSQGVADPSGPALLNFSTNKDDIANAAVMDAQGRVVMVGSSYDASGHQVFALARFNPSVPLKPDPNFGVNGMVTTSFKLGSNQAAQGVAVQSDGKIVAVGFVNTGTNTDFAVARYLPTGQLDTTFGNAGLVVTDFMNLDDTATAVAVQSGGPILVAGYSNNGNNTDFSLARYNANGSLDTSFGNSGKVMTDFGGDDYAKSIIMQDLGGWFLVSGYALSGNYYQFAAARYGMSGQLDTNFANSGKFLMGFSPNLNAYCYTSYLLPDQSVLLGGEAYTGVNQFDDAMIRLK
jgi:uncharacterized delta-60 repeat protein